ncbi:MAG: hypothetical protein ACLP59_28335 [Bryobacteraceae bacterium]
MGAVLCPDRSPIVKGGADQVDCSNCIGSRPDERAVVIGNVTFFLELHEGVRYVFQLQARRRLPGAVEEPYLILADVFHFPAVERSGKDTALTRDAPVANGFVDREMKQRVIRGGYGPAGSPTCSRAPRNISGLPAMIGHSFGKIDFS